MGTTPLTNPNLRADLPTYPVHLQALRVTGGTVPGPSGYASSSMLGPSLYVAFVQQLHPSTLLPRDREPCFALDLNRYGLAPGYYTNCRLAGSYQSLPVYEVGGAPTTPALALSQYAGLTAVQIESLSTLSPAQLDVLANLDVCQLQTLLTAVPISQIHTLTSTLTRTQLQTLIDHQTPEQLTATYTRLTTSQIILLTTALDPDEVHTITTALTPNQIAILTSVLTPTQLQLLTTLPPADLYYLVNNTTTAQLTNTFNNLTTAQMQTLFSLPSAQIVPILTNLTVPQTIALLTVPPGSVTYYPPATTVPPTPATGSIVYTDPGDAVLKAKDSNGDITILGSGSVTTRTEGTLVAAGTDQSSAAVITTDAVHVTGADGTKGVRLPDTEGAIIVVWNNSGSALHVYPPSGAQINGNGVNSSQSAGANAMSTFWRVTTTRWSFVELASSP